MARAARSTTYAELAAQGGCGRRAAAVEGIGKGDVVGLVGPNSAAWAIAYHAILRAGESGHPDVRAAHPEEIERQMANSGAKLLIDDAAGFVGGLCRARRRRKSRSIREDLAVLPYSSGTTGLMKGVMLTHRNLVANIEQAWNSMPLDDEDTLVGLMPFFHIYGQTVVLNMGFAKGATIVTMPRFDLDGLLDIIEEHGVTWLHIAPPIVLALATGPQVDGRDFSQLKLVISGAAPLDAELSGPRRGADRRADPAGLRDDRAQPGQPQEPARQSRGDPAGQRRALIPNTEARLVDPETGEDVAEGEAGELWVRGPQVMEGYLNNPEATARRSSRTAGCAPATSPASIRRASPTSSIGSRS